MTRDRALEIIAACGADPDRWPERERRSVLALASRDAELAELLAEAARLDRLLGQWLAAPVPVAMSAADHAADAALAAASPAGGNAAGDAAQSRHDDAGARDVARAGGRRRRWVAGGAVAAGLALSVLAPEGSGVLSTGGASGSAPAAGTPRAVLAGGAADGGVELASFDAASGPRPVEQAVPAQIIEEHFWSALFTPTFDEEELLI